MFKDLDDFLDDTLELPINGKTYRVPPVDAQTGVEMQRLFNLARAVMAGASVSDEQLAALNLDDAGEEAQYRRLLGPVYDEMVTDGVSWPRIRRSGQTAIAFLDGGREAAERVWNDAPKATRQAPRKAPARKATARARTTSAPTV